MNKDMSKTHSFILQADQGIRQRGEGLWEWEQSRSHKDFEREETMDGDIFIFSYLVVFWLELDVFSFMLQIKELNSYVALKKQ